MKRIIAIVCAAFGLFLACAPFVLLLSRHVRTTVLNAPAIAMAAGFVIYAAIMAITLDRYSGGVWPSLAVVTPRRLRVTRTALMVFVVLIALSAVVSVIANLTKGESLSDIAFVCLVVSSIALNGIYIGAHWIFRPSNLFGVKHIPRGVGNPIGEAIRLGTNILRGDRDRSRHLPK
jgi:hypothetical protein